MEKMERHPYRWLGLFGLIVFLAGNMYLAITDTAESNYALTAKEMVLAHNWLSPQIYGHYWYDKPIFSIGSSCCPIPCLASLNLHRAFHRHCLGLWAFYLPIGSHSAYMTRKLVLWLP